MQVHQPNKQYFCSTCQNAFDTNQTYKIHYKSDYHRYNIKRKMVKLPPVTLALFSTKLTQTKNQVTDKLQCNQCRKQFASTKTFAQHVQSKGHNPNMIIQVKQKVVKVPTIFAKNSKKCLFCDFVSAGVSENERHMSSAHTFFIASEEFCKNKEGLIEYLQEKIEVGNLCITCENKKAKDFQSADAVRKHMIDRGHTFMKTQAGFQEYEKFYDFSRLFEQKLKDQEKIVPGIEFQKVKVIVDENDQVAQQNDQEWEDEEDQHSEGWESDSEGDEQDIAQKPIKEAVKKPKVKTYHIMKPTLTANDELLLPNGKILGHRKYRYLYRQTLRAPNWFANQLKMITCGNSSVGNSLIDRRMLLDVMKKEQQLKRVMVRDKKYGLLIGLTNNGLQHHFRTRNSL